MPDTMLTTDERNSLIPEVALLTEGRPTRLTAFLPAPHVIRIATDNVPEMYAYNVVRYCEMSAWVEDPALIIKLLEQFSFLPVISDAIQRLKNSPPPRFHIGNRVWDTCLVALALPFLNREITRKALERFLDPLRATTKPPGCRVLVVNGDNKSGKTFTYDYIRYVNSFVLNINFKILWVDYKVQAADRFGPKELIECLLNQVNPGWQAVTSLPALDTEQVSRWMLEIARVFIDQITNVNYGAAAPGNWYIVLDNFNEQNVPRDTIDFIHILAKVAMGAELVSECNDMIRLVVLGFNEAIPDYRGRLVQEKINKIDKYDIDTYFTRYAAFAGKTLDADTLEALTNKVELDKIPDDEKRTATIATAVLNIVKTIF